jgi:acyl-CoA thioesterase-1
MAPWSAHFASGNALYSGGVLLLIASVLTVRRPRWFPSRIVPLPGVLGALLVALSATPLPSVAYGVWGLIFLSWLIVVRAIPKAGAASSPAGEAPRSRLSRWRRWAACLNAFVALAAMSSEAAALRFPPQQASRQTRIYVIGDSISAGMDDPPDRTWPPVMGRKYSVDVVNLAQPGGTAKSALKQARLIDHADAVVIIEIGGNDLLSGVPARQFRADLEALLRAVSAPSRTLVMLELPLPPFCNDYGRSQRELADAFGVRLISKRDFVCVLSSRAATVDGLHLSPAGHQLMADTVWARVQPLIR